MTLNKIKKLLKNPGIFFRDYFLSKYPNNFNESGVLKENEKAIIDSETELEKILTNKSLIDIVYTWVDGSEKKWRDKFELTFESNKKSNENHALSESRFDNNNEINYSIKSIKKNIPWVRNIYIITDGQSPSLDIDHKKNNIIIIDHNTIIPEVFLPTFNSHVIEAHLHKIPGLSENFLYFNDDVFVARNIDKTHFFDVNNRPSIFPSQKSLSKMKERGVKTPTLNASLNSADLLKKTHGVDIDRSLVHTYMPLRKKYFFKAWDLYGEEINSFLPNKARSENDLNLATFLVPWLTYLENDAVIKRDICYYFNLRSRSALKFYESLIKNKDTDLLPHSFCANDFKVSNKDMINYRDIMNEKLSKFFK